MDEDYDPLSHLSTALSLLPRTLAGIGFSLPVGLSEVDQMKAFFRHMDGVLKKDQKSGNKNLENYPGPNPNTIEKEGAEAGKNHLEGQQQVLKLAFLEPMQQHGTRSCNSKLSPNPDTIDRDETGKSFEGQLLDVKAESSEVMQLEQQPYMNSYANEFSPHTESSETRHVNHGQNWDAKLMELQPEPSISGHANKPSSKTNGSVVEKDETGKDSSQGKNTDTSFESVKATMMELQPSIISNAIANKLSLIPDNTKTEMGKTENISFNRQHQYCSLESVEFTEVVEQPSISIHVNKLSPNPDSMVLEKDKPGRINSDGENELDFRSVEPMVESRPSISSDSHNPSQVLDKTKIERNISERNSFHPEQMVENRRICQRPGLGLVYNISPFAPIQKCKNFLTIIQMDRNKKAEQVVPVDFTVLDHISDPDAFTKKAYELEAAVAEIKRLGGEPKIIGERVFKTMEDDQPRKLRPGLRVQLQQPEFVLLPMRPLPAKVQCVCACQNRAPTQRINSPETIKLKTSSGSQNQAPSSISNATEEVPEMNLYASSSSQRLLSILESCPEDEEKAIAMVFDCLNLKPTVIPPLVIPEMPKFSRLDALRSPWRQLPSVERVRELRGEDPLIAFEELKRKLFARSSAACYSDDDTNPLVGFGSVRSLSMSPGCQISFENEEIDTPSRAGPSGSPNVEIEEFPSQEKAPEMTSEARDGNTSDEDVAGDGLPDEPEMGSPWDNSPVHIEVAVSAVSLDNSPVNTVVAPSDMLLENQPEEVVEKETSSRQSKKRRLEHADSSLDLHSKILTPTSDSNTEVQAETSTVEPPRERDEQLTPPKKKNRKQQKRKSSIQIAEGGLQEVGGLRRSTRIRSRPLRHWMGERLLYARVKDNFLTAVGVKECSPATLGIRVKVRSFLSDEHADLVARLAM